MTDTAQAPMVSGSLSLFCARSHLLVTFFSSQILRAHRTQLRRWCVVGSFRPLLKVHPACCSCFCSAALALTPLCYYFTLLIDRELVQRYRSYMAARSKMDNVAAAWMRPSGQ